MVMASQMITQSTSSCCCWWFILATVILAVAAIAGADYSAFVIFIPLFIVAGALLCCITCFICCMRGDLDEEMGERPGGPDQRGSGEGKGGCGSKEEAEFNLGE